MTAEERALLGVVRLLETLGIPYMVVGSVASSHHGRPRATHDSDIVIDPSRESLEALIQRLKDSGFYVNPERAREAFAARRQFNVIAVQSASKVDLILRKERAFSREEFRRRYEAEIAQGLRIMLSSAEDTIVAKLEWAKKSGESERQLRDVAGVLDVNPDLDRAYVSRWADELGIEELWRRVLEGRS